MADNNLTVSRLSVNQVRSTRGSGDGKLSFVIAFTANGATWEITIPDILNDEITGLIRQFL